MGFLSRLFKPKPLPITEAASGALPTAEAPSAAFATPTDAIAYLVEAQRAHDGAWVTLDAEAGGRQASLQIADANINLLLDGADLTAVLAAAGRPDLAARIAMNGADATLWKLEGATPQEMAVAVDEIFARHFELGRPYRLRGEVEG